MDHAQALLDAYNLGLATKLCSLDRNQINQDNKLLAQQGNLSLFQSPSMSLMGSYPDDNKLMSSASSTGSADTITGDSPKTIDSDRNPRRWSTEEDDKLREAVNMFGDKRWKDIAIMVGTRDNVQCLQRWRKSLRPGLIKGPWRPDEDSLLRQKYLEKQANQTLTWSWVASHIDGRNAKQCRERWQNFLDEGIRRGNWTSDEDDLLCDLYIKYNGRWATIAREIPGRTENSVKVRYQSLGRFKRKFSSEPPKDKVSADHSLNTDSRLMSKSFSESSILSSEENVNTKMETQMKKARCNTTGSFGESSRLLLPTHENILGWLNQENPSATLAPSSSLELAPTPLIMQRLPSVFGRQNRAKSMPTHYYSSPSEELHEISKKWSPTGLLNSLLFTQQPLSRQDS